MGCQIGPILICSVAFSLVALSKREYSKAKGYLWFRLWFTLEGKTMSVCVSIGSCVELKTTQEQINAQQSTVVN